MTTQSMLRLCCCLLACLACVTSNSFVNAFVPSVPSFTGRTTTASSSSWSTQLHNLLSDIGDMFTGGKLADAPVAMPYSPPMGLGGDGSSSNMDIDSKRVFAVQERALSFTGEDFDVSLVDPENGSESSFCRVRGAMLHLPGKDKMRIKDSNTGDLVCELDRKLVAMTPTYDIYRRDTNEKLGWIEKKAIALTDVFDVYMEGKGGVGPFKPPPAFSLEGDFIDRTFVMKNAQNEIVAKVIKDSLIQFDAFNHYQVQVAPGMDADLVVACCCAIDEEFDEEHKAEKERQQQED